MRRSRSLRALTLRAGDDDVAATAEACSDRRFERLRDPVRGVGVIGEDDRLLRTELLAEKSESASSFGSSSIVAPATCSWKPAQDREVGRRRRRSSSASYSLAASVRAELVDELGRILRLAIPASARPRDEHTSRVERSQECLVSAISFSTVSRKAWTLDSNRLSKPVRSMPGKRLCPLVRARSRR